MRLFGATPQERRQLRDGAAAGAVSQAFIQAARSAAGEYPDTPLRFLAVPVAVDLLSTNRWLYTVRPVLVTAAHGLSAPSSTDQFGRLASVLNLREFNNSASVIDGIALPTGASIGPVGSAWNTGSAAWVLSETPNPVEVVCGYRDDGSLLAWFSEINPSRCAA